MTICSKTFVKWNGGKTNILKDLDELFPNLNDIKGYIEPFLGVETDKEEI